MLCKRWLNGDSKTQKVVVLARILHRQRTQNKRRKWNNKKWDDHLCSVFCHIIFQKRRSLGDWNGDKIYRHGLLQLFATSLRHGAQKEKACSRETNKQNAKNTTVTIFPSNTYRVFILAFIESQKAGLLRLPFWASFLYALIISFEAELARKIITKAKKQLL